MALTTIIIPENTEKEIDFSVLSAAGKSGVEFYIAAGNIE